MLPWCLCRNTGFGPALSTVCQLCFHRCSPFLLRSIALRFHAACAQPNALQLWVTSFEEIISWGRKNNLALFLLQVESHQLSSVVVCPRVQAGIPPLSLLMQRHFQPQSVDNNLSLTISQVSLQGWPSSLVILQLGLNMTPAEFQQLWFILLNIWMKTFKA